MKIDKSAEAKRISSQIVETVIDRTVYHGTNFAPDIVNEIVNNVTRDVGSNNNDDSLSTEKCIYNIWNFNKKNSIKLDIWCCHWVQHKYCNCGWETQVG